MLALKMTSASPRVNPVVWMSALGGVAAMTAVLAASAPLSVFALPAGVAFVAAVIAYPYAGLVGLVVASQLGGLLERVIPIPANAFQQVLAAAVVLGVALQTWREPRRERWGPDSLALRFAVLFAFALLLSTFFSEDRVAAVDGLRKRLNLLLLFYLIVRMVNTAPRVRTLVFAIVVSTAISAGVSVFSYTTGSRLTAVDKETVNESKTLRRQAGANTAGPNAAAQGMLVGSGIAAVLATRNRKGRLFLAGCAILGLGGIVVSFSRSAALATCACIGWWCLKLRRSRRFVPVVAVFVFLGAVGLSLVPATYWQRLSTLGQPGSDYTLSRRLGYQLIGLELLRSHPLVGVGPDTFKLRYTNFEYRWMPGRTLTTRALHNMYLSVAVETGLLGFVCFSALLLVAIRSVYRVARDAPDPEMRNVGEALLFAYMPYLLLTVFGPAETSKNTWILTGFAVALAQVAFPAKSGVRAGDLARPTTVSR